jgi:hypothetical protein
MGPSALQGMQLGTRMAPRNNVVNLSLAHECTAWDVEPGQVRPPPAPTVDGGSAATASGPQCKPAPSCYNVQFRPASKALRETEPVGARYDSS